MLREKLVDLRIASAAASHSGFIENAREIYQEAAGEIRRLIAGSDQ